MTSEIVPLEQLNTKSRISLEILEQCSSNLALEKYITKRHLLCCYHGNTFGSNLFLCKNKIFGTL